VPNVALRVQGLQDAAAKAKNLIAQAAAAAQAAALAAQQKVADLSAALAALAASAVNAVGDGLDAARAKGVETVNAARAALELQLAAAKNALAAASAAREATLAGDASVTIIINNGYQAPADAGYGSDASNQKTSDATVKLSAASACFDTYLACAKAAEDPSACVNNQRTCLAAAAA
jgi:hypothetical protein